MERHLCRGSQRSGDPVAGDVRLVLESTPIVALEPCRVPPLVMRDSIVLSHSLIPDAMRHVFQGYGAMLDPALPLSRRQHELIALAVSVINGCCF